VCLCVPQCVLDSQIYFYDHVKFINIYCCTYFRTPPFCPCFGLIFYTRHLMITRVYPLKGLIIERTLMSFVDGIDRLLDLEFLILLS